MTELDKTLIDYCDDIFGEFLSDLFVGLRKNNQEYQNLRDEKEEILTNFPDIRHIIEDRVAVNLNKEEVQGLIDYLDKIDDIRSIQEKTIFLSGMRECCKILEKLELLKI